VRKGRLGFTEFNQNQINALKKGDDISNVEFLSVAEQSSPVVNHSSEGNASTSDDVEETDRDAVLDSPACLDPCSNSENENFTFPVHCFCWRDKKPVFFVNNITHPREVSTVARKQKDGTNITLNCPLAVSLYNQYMGGVDMADAMRRLYSCSRKSKNKWYMRLFWFLIDTCIVNAYILECESPNHPATRSIGKRKKRVYETQLDFVVHLAQQLIEKHDSRQRVGRQPVMPMSESRYTVHVPCKYSSQRDCKQCKLQKRPRTRSTIGCAECGVPLCIYPCFAEYHTR